MAKYTVQKRIVDGQLVDIKVYAARPRKVKHQVRVAGSTRASGARYIALHNGQVLRCEKCHTVISRDEEKWGGTCTRC